jgi:diacylglycerol kinase family enzyme
MRVSMLINPDAGGEADAETIRHGVQRHGHEIVSLIDTSHPVERLLEADTDLIVVCGGDGTVAEVARLMAGRPCPMTILPMGTANNIAIALDCVGSLDALIDHWQAHDVRPMDLGRVCGPFGERRFVESLGGGLVADTIAMMDARDASDAGPVSWRLDRAVDGYLEKLADARPLEWRLHADGTEHSGRYLLVEVLNIKSIGPRIVVADEADAFDGVLTLALATGDHGHELARYFLTRAAGAERPLWLTTTDAATLSVGGGSGRLHIDDDVIDVGPDASVTIEVEPGALLVLRGPGA